eukprot:1157526-Pelagomonas_calceolata.AAC.12
MVDLRCRCMPWRLQWEGGILGRCALLLQMHIKAVLADQSVCMAGCLHKDCSKGTGTLDFRAALHERRDDVEAPFPFPRYCSSIPMKIIVAATQTHTTMLSGGAGYQWKLSAEGESGRRRLSIAPPTL